MVGAMPSQLWKMPPLIKVYEALGALGDARVVLEPDGRARVTSSEGNKVYQIETSEDLREIASNDNASYWQGYLGYPAIAVLLARGLFPVSRESAVALAKIPWKQLNREHRNDYARTLAEVDNHVREHGGDPAAVRAEAGQILAALARLEPRRGPRRRPPAEPPLRRRTRS